jgi:hypothetical protein
VAGGGTEVAIRRIVAGFDAGGCRLGTLRALAALAAETGAELLGVFIEETDLLRLAQLPFAAEIGYPSAMARGLDPRTLERALRVRAEALRAALGSAASRWTFRVARGHPAEVLAAALAEGDAPVLLIPPRARPHAERRIVRQPELGETLLRELVAAARPLLVLPE